MTTHALPRQGGGTAATALPFLGDLALTLARVHEACGGARRTFAAMLAGATEGVVMWIQPAWRPERINPEALMAFAAPNRFLFVYPRRPEDLLWTMEEVLRSAAAPLVVADLLGPPGLTPVRRLHLAAETGAALGKGAPLGLILTPGDGGAQGVESRWRLAADHAAGEGRGWRLTRLRARAEPPRDWRVVPDGKGLRLAGLRASVAPGADTPPLPAPSAPRPPGGAAPSRA